MKKARLRIEKLTLVLLLTSCLNWAYGQKKQANYNIGLSTHISTEETLPFWLVSNRHGVVPDHNNGMLDVSLFSTFAKDKKNGWDYAWGVTAVGAIADENDMILQEAYVSIRWNWLQLDLGAKDRPVRFDGLSVTNGDLLYSGNARSIPEIKFRTNGFVPLGFTKNWIAFKGCFSNGFLWDHRFVENVNVHHKNFFLRIGKEQGFSVVAGIDHYAQWNGNSPVYGDLGSFKDFFKVVANQAGHVLTRVDNGDTSITESYNKIGNHLGQNSLEVNYADKGIQSTLYVKNIYEDKSGDLMHLPSVRDWNLGLFLKFRDGKVIRSVMYEYFYTKHQGGYSIRPDHPIEPVIGFDSYFNNSVYRSGWTHYGRTIGLPLFTPQLQSEDGVIKGVRNNAIRAHHFGVAGGLCGFEYKLLATFSDDYGQVGLKNDGLGKNKENYSKTYTFDPSLNQQSYLLELKFPPVKIPFDLYASLAYDKGDLLGENFGFSVRIVKSGLFH